MQQFEVGQVFYVVSESNISIRPYIVVEEVIRKTIDGLTTTTLVRPVSSKDGHNYDLKSIKDPIYSDLQRVREVLIQNATNAIDGILAKTQKLVDSTTQEHSE